MRFAKGYTPWNKKRGALQGEDLRRLYWDELLTQKEIAEIFNVSAATISHALRDHGIETKTPSSSRALRHTPAWNHGKPITGWMTPDARALRRQKLLEHTHSPWLGKHCPWTAAKNRDPCVRARQSARFKGKPLADIIGVDAASRVREHCRQLGLSRRDCHCRSWHDSPDAPAIIAKIVKSLMKRPTCPEARLIRIIDDYQLPYKYVGNGEVILGGLNPDFIEVNGKKEVVEVFGDAFHNPKKSFKPLRERTTEEGRRKCYAEYGYRMLVLWVSEMHRMTDSEIADRITYFSRSHVVGD